LRDEGRNPDDKKKALHHAALYQDTSCF